MGKLKWILLVVVLTVSGLGGGLFYTSKWKLQTLLPKKGRVVESVYGLGTVVTDKTFHVRSAITQSVRKVFIEEGQKVRPGDPLVQLDDNVIRSQIEGTITKLNYSFGELVPPQSSTLVVTNLESLFLEVSLEQQSVLRIKNDQRATVSFESLRGEKFEGRVKSIYPRENQFIVRIALPKWPVGVLPGMTADVAILVGEKQNALLIPIQSIVAGRVTRLRDGKKEVLNVELGVIDEEWAEVISGDILESDQLVSRRR